MHMCVCVSLSLSLCVCLSVCVCVCVSVCVCGNRYLHPGKASPPKSTCRAGGGWTHCLASANEDPSNVVVKRTCSPAPGVRGGQLVRHHFTFIFISFRATLFLRVWRNKGLKPFPARIISSCVCVPFLWSGTHGTKISFHHHDRRR